MSTYIYFAIGFIIFYIGKKIFNNFFYSPIEIDGWTVYNLPLIAESFQIAIYVGAGLIQCYTIFSGNPSLEEWVIAVIWILYFFVKGIFIFGSRNNCIEIKENNVRFRNGDEIGHFTFTSFNFYEKESEAVAFSKNGWFLYLKCDGDKSLEFDLKNMHLEEFKDSMEKQLRNES